MITLQVSGQVLTAHCCDVLVSDSLNAIDIQFAFSEEWAGMTKTAQFTQENAAKELVTYNVLLNDFGEAMLPNEITAGVVVVSVFGVKGAVRLTTAPLALPVAKSGFVGDGETPIPPTPDLYAQLIEQFMAGATVKWENVQDKPATYPAAAHVHTYNELTGKPFAYAAGRDLSTVFASANALHAAVAAGDFSKISVGDYWPITLNGKVHDYASGTDKTLTNAVIHLEVAGIDNYLRSGDTELTAHHLTMCSRDLPPFTAAFRSEASTWHDTAATNPWTGSHLYETLNNETDGLLALVAATDIGAHIFAGPNGKGMRFSIEKKAAGATYSSAAAWHDRGKLFIPTEAEVFGSVTWGETLRGSAIPVRWPIFATGTRSIVKGAGHGGSRRSWWLCNSQGNSATAICYVASQGGVNTTSAADTWLGCPLCFLLT